MTEEDQRALAAALRKVATVSNVVSAATRKPWMSGERHPALAAQRATAP